MLNAIPQGGRHRPRAGRAADRSRAGGALRVHRRRSSTARSARRCGPTNGSSPRRTKQESARLADELRPQFHAEGDAARARAGVRAPPAVPARRSRSTRSTRSPASWTGDQNRVVMVTRPQKAGLTVPDEATLAAVVKGVGGEADYGLRRHRRRRGAPRDRSRSPGRSSRRRRQEASGITEWELSNGVKVVLKPTDFKQDEIVFRATSPGGTSLASDADFIPASTAAQVMSRSGHREVQRDRSAEGRWPGKIASVPRRDRRDGGRPDRQRLARRTWRRCSS